jgi:glycosyltransferase involved in cell wall biosynthesis
LTKGKPRLTFVTNNLYLVGGGERLALEMVIRLKKDYDIQILNPMSSKEKVVERGESFVKSYDLSGVKLENLDSFGIRMRLLATEPYVLRIPKPSSMAKLVSTIRRSDIVYQMSLNPISVFSSIILSKIFGKKLVLGVHNFSVSVALQPARGIASGIRRRLIIAILGQVGYFHVTNNRDFRLMTGLFPDAKVRNIPNFITRKSSKVTNNSKEFRCLYVGRLESSGKGTDLLCKAIDIIAEKNREIKFWIIGKGTTGEALVTERVRRYPKIVKWLGFVNDDELNRAYDEASLFTHPSRGEAFSLSVLEAQSHGLPAVVFDIDGPRDLIKNDFQGNVVRKFDVKEFAQSIEDNYNMWRRDKNGYGKRKVRIKEYVYENYSPEKVIAQLKKFFAS